VTDRPPRQARAEPREVLELRQLKVDQPDLASAVDMQIALVDIQRRVQSRVPLPWMQVDAEWLCAQLAAGRPLVRFADIPLDWTDFRLTLRQTADILRRFDALDASDYDAIVTLGREGRALQPLLEQWYTATSNPHDQKAERLPEGTPASLDHVFALALRPFLARCSEALSTRSDLPSLALAGSSHSASGSEDPVVDVHGHCPFCGWEPDFAVITASADRRLICGRCGGQWPFPPLTCPFCGNDDRKRVTSFATRDGRYRVYACDVCRRYLKAYDGRHAHRPVMVSVDTIATLPLDAAAMQRGYTG
jgi:hypothetical protein